MAKHFYRNFESLCLVLFRNGKPPEAPTAAPAPAPEGQRPAASPERAEAASRAAAEARKAGDREQFDQAVEALLNMTLTQEGIELEADSIIRQRFSANVINATAQYQEGIKSWFEQYKDSLKPSDKGPKLTGKTPAEQVDELNDFILKNFAVALSLKTPAEIASSLANEMTGLLFTQPPPEQAKTDLMKIFQKHVERIYAAIARAKQEWKLSKLPGNLRVLFGEYAKEGVDAIVVDASGNLTINADNLTKALQGKSPEEVSRIQADLEALRSQYNGKHEEGEKVGGIFAKGGILAMIVEMFKSFLEALKGFLAQLGFKGEEEKPKPAAEEKAAAPAEGQADAEAKEKTPEEKATDFLQAQIPELTTDELALLKTMPAKKIADGKVTKPADFAEERFGKVSELLKTNGADKITDTEQNVIAFFEEKFRKEEEIKPLS